ncbi:ABC transporter ATP-binding protein [Streptomyces aculeolatus]|uniref:ABC transporter ATP-binding protein n=1 Tax=Streptomyces aculeolatus TaxID=270689 RepID=UPI000567F532|nr:ABC transporter ATP-binding protein [Streptomyces aculeolatus]
MVSAQENVISAAGLRRTYGDFEAVRGVDFAVRRGELFALLGTNGAGKTSTVELLEGLAEPSGGEVRVLGRDPYRERGRVRPYTGVMLQEGGMPSQLTAAETVRMWAGCTARPRPVAEALELVGLSDRRDVRVSQLSGGERRRLDLALALLGRPEVLFLDEPTTGLDAEGRHATWELVRELRAGGTTVLLTTHYLEEAQELADRLAIMAGGRIAAAGTVEEIVGAHPATVSFRLPVGWLPGDLPPLPALGVTGHELAGTSVRLRTDALQRTLTGLLLWAQDNGVELAGLDARSASLEEAFLKIAGAAEDDRRAGAAKRREKGAGPPAARAADVVRTDERNAR